MRFGSLHFENIWILDAGSTEYQVGSVKFNVPAKLEQV